ncbi:hypothetical protein Sjap_006335 [Stephania japonica]|uniref:DUF3475 domain-containing protein n=1 Tax=Stephania japonica TaxID=461633 RepID=A0AAP0K838_9MAGN
MVAEAWILRMGNQVSHNLKHALSSDHSNSNHSRKTEEKEIVGIISFEVANVMSKIVHLHKSLSEREMYSLRNEVFTSEGVSNLVSSDESRLLELALAEKLDDLNRVAAVVSRLGKKCNESALQGFEHVYGDIVCGVIGVGQLGFLVKDMEGMVRKMERFASSTTSLYSEIQVLNELEQASKKFVVNQNEESRRVFEQKLIWQRQEVRNLKDISIWNQTYDKMVGLLARTICTVFFRICAVFGDSVQRMELRGVSTATSVGSSGGEGLSLIQKSGLGFGIVNGRSHSQTTSEPLDSVSVKGSFRRSERFSLDKIKGTTPGLALQRSVLTSIHQQDVRFPCGASPARLLMECLSLSSSAAPEVDQVVNNRENSNTRTAASCNSTIHGLKREQVNPSNCSNWIDKVLLPFGTSSSSRVGTKSKLLLYASPTTVGGSSLALHYANVIIVIEKLLQYPHLVGDEARDDLYEMLPTSLRTSLRKKLKSYVKGMAIYDAPLAHEWMEKLDRMLKWFAPLAHNMIRWQTERNLEQQQIITKTNVLLLHTLYFADREKTEAAICELLVGLNYVCRYEHQQNALLDCASSFDFEDCPELRWREPFL